MRGTSVRAGLVAACALISMLLIAPGAGAVIPGSLSSSCSHDSTAPEDYWFCNDGTPGFGGTTPNPTGADAVAVPAKYGGDGVSGVPSEGPPAPPAPRARPDRGDA